MSGNLPASSTGEFLTTALGDVYARVVNGVEQGVNPDEWGWLVGPREKRRALGDVEALPGFTVSVEGDPGIVRVPGPRPKRSKGFFKWKDGAAPPAAVLSKAGAADGTRAQYGRLSDAVAGSVSALPRNPQSRPFLVLDVIRGHRIVIDYDQVVEPGGVGSVYVVEDGLGVKIGHTTGPVDVRVAALQTGNPRLISTIAIVVKADQGVETHLHEAFARWSMHGEWFDRNQLLAAAREAKGWGRLVRSHLPEGMWEISVFPPYS